MRFRQLAILLGPVAIRDLAAGTVGVATGTLAFLVGCAYASTFNFVWFAFWGIQGVMFLGMALPVLRLVRRMPTLAVVSCSGFRGQ